MKKFKHNKVDLNTLKSNRNTLEKKIEQSKWILDNYIADCKKYNETLDPNVVKQIEEHIVKMTEELKKLNSSIDNYEEFIRKSKY